MHTYFVSAGARAVLLLALCCAGAQAAPGWPVVALPADVTTFPIGEQMAVNGVPLQLRGFVSRSAPAALADWFRKSLGQPVMENYVGDKLVLGRPEGTFFITVQLEALGPGQTGTRGTVAVSDLKAASDRRADAIATSERHLARLPNGSHLITQTSSIDGGKIASYVLAENGHSEELNRNSLVERLRAEGYTLEREAQADRGNAPALPEQLMQGRTLFFKGAGKEAMAVIHHAGPGRTTVILNTVTLMEHVK